MINYVIGDATEPQGGGPKIIAHICNDIGAWGAGFTGAISRKWLEPERVYRRHHRTSGHFPLGSIQNIRVDLDNDNLEYTVVCNMIAQHGINKEYYGTPFRTVNYGALAKCLNNLAEYQVAYRQSIHMPRIGAGLGGGDWDIIEELIEYLLVQRGINVTVYDLPERN